MKFSKEIGKVLIDFDDPDPDIRALDEVLLETYPNGFVRNCCPDEKIMVMQRAEKCPTHCWVNPGIIRLYLELPKDMHYSGPI